MALPEITADMQVTDLVAAYPHAVKFLASENLHCIVCGEPVWGTLRELATDKHFNEEKIDEIVAGLRNNLLSAPGTTP